MKRILTLLLAGALAMGALAGCGGGSNSSSAAPASSAASSEASGAASGEAPAENTGAPSGEIEIWCWDANFNIPAAEEAANVYKAINPDVTVKVTEVTSNEIYTKLTAAVTGGQLDTLPDIMLMHDRNIYKYVTAYEGVFASLDASGIDFTQFAEYKLQAGNVNGSPHAVPFDNGTTVTAMRIDLLEEAGYTIDDFTDITWDRFIEIGTDVYAKTNRPLIIDRTDTPQLLNTMLQSTGSWYFNNDGTVNITSNTALKTVFETYKKLVDNNVLARYNDGDSYSNALWSDNTTGLVNACWILGTVVKGEEQSGQWRITNTPRFDGVDGADNYSNNGGSSWMVFENGNKEAAMDYLKETFAGSQEFYNTILPSTSAIATWLPAQSGSNYTAPHPFFGDQPIYEMIMQYSANVPRVSYGIYSDEAYQAANTALANVLNGTDIDSALQEAESQVTFAMQ